MILSHRDRINAAVAAVTAGGIAYDHCPFGENWGWFADHAGREIARLLGDDDVNKEALAANLDCIRRAVPGATRGMDINIAERIQTIEKILGLPLTPLPVERIPA